jgi:hypothetical protein
MYQVVKSSSEPSVACIVSYASSSFLGDLEAVAGLQVTIYGVQIPVLELHVASIVLEIEQVFADVQCHESVRG